MTVFSQYDTPHRRKHATRRARMAYNGRKPIHWHDLADLAATVLLAAVGAVAVAMLVGG